jgi:molybdopterin-guanine dinucleotide biosynthesis protein A
MGRDKARLRVQGEPLWRRQVRVLRAAGAEPVVIVQRPGQRVLTSAIACVRDAWDEAGPLAGVHAALAATEARWVAVLAVDMPRIEPGWFEWLRRYCRPGVGAVARVGGVAEDPAGGRRRGRGAATFEPLAAIYPREAAAVAARRLARGRRSMQEFVAALAKAGRMRVVAIPDDKSIQVANWNTPADRAAAERV